MHRSRYHVEYGWSISLPDKRSKACFGYANTRSDAPLIIHTVMLGFHGNTHSHFNLYLYQPPHVEIKRNLFHSCCITKMLSQLIYRFYEATVSGLRYSYEYHTFCCLFLQIDIRLGNWSKYRAVWNISVLHFIHGLWLKVRFVINRLLLTLDPSLHRAVNNVLKTTVPDRSPNVIHIGMVSRVLEWVLGWSVERTAHPWSTVSSVGNVTFDSRHIVQTELGFTAPRIHFAHRNPSSAVKRPELEASVVTFPSFPLTTL
jgi:hypothetical protein